MDFRSQEEPDRSFVLEFQTTFLGNTRPQIGEGIIFPLISSTQNLLFWSLWNLKDGDSWHRGNKPLPARVVDVRHNTSETELEGIHDSAKVLTPVVIVSFTEKESFKLTSEVISYRSNLERLLHYQKDVRKVHSR